MGCSRCRTRRISPSSCLNTGNFILDTACMITHTKARPEPGLTKAGAAQKKPRTKQAAREHAPGSGSGSMDQKDLPALLVQCTVPSLNLKCVDRRRLFESLIPRRARHYNDWARDDRRPPALRQLRPGRQRGLAPLGRPGRVAGPHVDIATSHSSLSQSKAALKTRILDSAGSSPGWTRQAACRMILLQMIQGLQSIHANELLTSRTLARNTWESTVQLLAGLCKSVTVGHRPVQGFLQQRSTRCVAKAQWLISWSD